MVHRRFILGSRFIVMQGHVSEAQRVPPPLPPSSSLINMALIGCWEDSADDWLLWHSVLLSDFVEPYWNQSEAVQIVWFLMTLTEGSSTCDDIPSGKHNLHHQASRHPRPLFFLLRAANTRSCCQRRTIKLRYIKSRQDKTTGLKHYSLQLCFQCTTYIKGHSLDYTKGFRLVLSVLTTSRFSSRRNFGEIIEKRWWWRGRWKSKKNMFKNLSINIINEIFLVLTI